MWTRAVGKGHLRIYVKNNQCSFWTMDDFEGKLGAGAVQAVQERLRYPDENGFVLLVDLLIKVRDVEQVAWLK